MIPAPVNDVSPSVTLGHVVLLARGAHAERAPGPALVVLPQIDLCGIDAVATSLRPCGETRRLSDDHEDGVEATRHRSDGVDATTSRSSSFSALSH